MHSRYTDQEMAAIWSEQEKYETWFEVEHKVCEIYAELGKIPYDTPKTMESLRESCFAGDFVAKIEEIEKGYIINRFDEPHSYGTKCPNCRNRR